MSVPDAMNRENLPFPLGKGLGVRSTPPSRSAESLPLRVPVAIIRGVDYDATDDAATSALIRPAERDLFR